LALLPIGNKPVLCYQLEFLEENGLHDILIVIEKKYLHKVERYLKDVFKTSSDKTEIELIVVQEEEESANVLKLLKDRIKVIQMNP
jgi:NDP-sugar pyrophosphorylase family protein